MTRRLQVLVDEDRWVRLEQHAKRRGTSVATLVREAIDAAFPRAEPSATEAADAFLRRPARDIGDWESTKEELDENLGRGLRA